MAGPPAIAERTGIVFDTYAALDYDFYGMRVRSSIPLPVAVRPNLDSRSSDLIIDHSPDITEPDSRPTAVIESPGQGVIARYYRNHAGCWVWNNLVGTCFISRDGRSVLVNLDAVTSIDALGQLLIGQVAVIALLRQGIPVLHASAIAFDGSAVAFVAPSGHGKTTMAVSFLRHGARLLTDDALPLAMRPDGVYGVPGVPMMKVWPETVEQCLGLVEDLRPLATAPEKRLMDIGADHQFSLASEPLRLRSVYVLRRYDPQLSGRSDILIRTLTARDRVAALLSNTLQQATLNPVEAASMLPIYSRLALQAPVKILSFPDGYRYQCAVRQAVLSDLEDRQ